MVARQSALYVAFALILLCVLIVGAVSCMCLKVGPGGRWDRYEGGGSFIGGRPSVSPTRGELVYASPETGHGDIYLATLVGIRRTRLTSDLNYEGDPAWSPDGETIAFARECRGGASIWVVGRDGSNLRRITATNSGYDAGPSFSTDGQRIVFSRMSIALIGGSESSNELYTIRIDGTEESRLTFNNRPDWQASYVPSDDGILYCVGSEEIRILEPSSLKSHFIARGSSPAVSPDGKTIAFIDDQPQSFAYDLFTTDLSGREPSRITRTGGYKSDPAFLPDGKQIIFIQQTPANGVGTIVVVDVEGHETPDFLRLSKWVGSDDLPTDIAGR